LRVFIEDPIEKNFGWAYLLANLAGREPEPDQDVHEILEPVSTDVEDKLQKFRPSSVPLHPVRA
jgi:hypothetical protein